MKKNLFVLSAISSVLLASTAVNANTPSADLYVKGKLTAPTCKIAAPNNGEYNIGNISSTIINATEFTVLQDSMKVWEVSCDADTYLNISTVDQQKASVAIPGNTVFGLGSVNETGKIGYFKVLVQNPKVDGKDVRLFSSSTTSFTPATTAWLDTTKRVGWATATSDAQASGKNFTAELVVKPTLASSETMNGPITDTVAINGALTLNFAFGI